jgi:hypothetical protein
MGKHFSPPTNSDNRNQVSHGITDLFTIHPFERFNNSDVAFYVRRLVKMCVFRKGEEIF